MKITDLKEPINNEMVARGGNTGTHLKLRSTFFRSCVLLPSIVIFNILSKSRILRKNPQFTLQILHF